MRARFSRCLSASAEGGSSLVSFAVSDCGLWGPRRRPVGKAAVFGLLERHSGKVHTYVVPARRSERTSRREPRATLMA